jgi:hypothetical protein
MGSRGRGYRRTTAATLPAVAAEEINENLIIGRPLAPSGRFQKRPAGGPQLRKSGGPELRKSDGLQPKKLGGPQQRKSCNSVALKTAAAFSWWLFTIVRRECQRLSRRMFRQGVSVEDLTDAQLATRSDEGLHLVNSQSRINLRMD